MTNPKGTTQIDIHGQSNDYHDMRTDYKNQLPDEHKLADDPFVVFEQWFQERLNYAATHDITQEDPNAFVLATVDQTGQPDARVVLLKSIKQQQFIFYTNYNSAKGQQIAQQPQVAMNFYWPCLARQIRICGTANKIATETSHQYFNTRPFNSQVAASISAQSQPIDYEQLQQAFKAKQQACAGQVLSCPADWGGYAVTPSTMEFWLGRESRLHFRIKYERQDHEWSKQVLAP